MNRRRHTRLWMISAAAGTLVVLDAVAVYVLAQLLAARWVREILMGMLVS